MNTNTGAVQVKRLTRCPTVLLRDLTDFYRFSGSVNHHVFTCEALSSRRMIARIIKKKIQPLTPSISQRKPTSYGHQDGFAASFHPEVAEGRLGSQYHLGLWIRDHWAGGRLKRCPRTVAFCHGRCQKRVLRHGSPRWPGHRAA